MIRRGGVGTEGTRRGHDSLGSTQQVWDASGCYVTVAKIRLEVIGSEAPAAELEAERIVIGSHESAHFVVADATVSRLHCELIPASDRVVLRDLDSKNGTRIHGISIKEATLTGTAVLQLGHSKLRVSVERDTANLPLFEGEQLGRLVGQSAAMRRVFAIVEKAATVTDSVLIQGEPGTGKAAVAATIHQLSPRADKPLLVLDCSAFPRDLLDAELFGCERGAMGSVAGRPGVFELADSGSLLLDEVGELPVELQPKLLGVLERGSVRRVGGQRSIPVNVRVMAATNRSLGAEVNGHRFRSDLYYRLAGIQVALPPLRSRFEDLPLLVDDLAERLSLTDEERSWLGSMPLMTDLTAHHWSGNVRELRSYVEACLALRTRDVVDAPAQAEDAKPLEVDTSLPLAEARGACVAAFERGYAIRMLRQHQGDVTAAARAAGTDRLTFCRLLLRLGIR